MKLYKACLRLQIAMYPSSTGLSGFFRKSSICEETACHAKNVSLHTKRSFFWHANKQNLDSNSKVQAPYSSSTIFSLSSGHGKCGVAVVRISGSRAEQVMEAIALLKIKPKPREAFLRRLVDPATGVTIDKGLVLYFPGMFWYFLCIKFTKYFLG